MSSVRISFDIDQETHVILAKLIPHGMHKYAYKALLEAFAEKLEDQPAETLSRVFANKVGLKELIKEPGS